MFNNRSCIPFLFKKFGARISHFVTCCHGGVLVLKKNMLFMNINLYKVQLGGIKCSFNTIVLIVSETLHQTAAPPDQ